MAHSQRAIITFLDSSDPDPGYGVPSLPGFSGNRPDNSLPGLPNYPSNALPGGGHISLLPVFPFDPTKPVDPDKPSTGGPGIDNELPIRPGRKFIVKWLCGAGLILVPDNELPSSGGSVDNELPEHAQPK